MPDEAAIIERLKSRLQAAVPPPQQRNPGTFRPARAGAFRSRSIRRLLTARASPAQPSSPPLAPIAQLAKSGFSFFIDHGRAADIRGIYRGGSVFLICGGPSLAGIDLTPLKQPGIVTMGVNNAAKVFRPNLWIHGDAVDHFLKSIWYDPTITKFCPLSMRGGRVWDSARNAWDARTARECPNVLFYPLGGSWKPESFLSGSSADWGDGGSRMTFVAALRVLYELGFRRVFLLGVDFAMDASHKYAFDQDRSEGSIRGNNSSYRVTNDRITAIQPQLLAAGFKVFNCTSGSKLTAFPQMAFDAAVAAVLDDFGNIDVANEPTAGLYDKPKPKYSPPATKAKVFTAYGKFGDIIYGLAAVKAMGGGTLRIVPRPGGINFYPPTKTLEILGPLIRQQPYVHGVEIGTKVEGISLDAFRGKSRTNLAEQIATSIGAPADCVNAAWLTVKPRRAAAVIINRSARYQNPKFPWKSVVDKYGVIARFVGLESEHVVFCKAFGAVEYMPTANLLEVAEAIAACDLFIGNQSSPYAIAEGLKVRTIQETSPTVPDCIFPRDNAVYGRNESVILPDIRLPSVRLLTQYSDLYTPIFKLSESSNAGYCQRWSITYDRRHYNYAKDEKWGARELAMLDALPRCDWLWFMGADAIVMNHCIDVRSRLDENYDVVIATDHKTGINNDVIFLRNCDATIAFLNRVNDLRMKFKNDQEATKLALTQVPGLRVKYCSQRLFNAFIPDRREAVEDDSFHPGDFVLHLAGLPMDRREQLMREYAGKVMR